MIRNYAMYCYEENIYDGKIMTEKGQKAQAM